MEKTCCFTGHRVQKLPWRNNELDFRCIALKNKLKNEIINAIRKGYSSFFCGMALGFDFYCAEAVLDLKSDFPHIKLFGALPCNNQDCKWNDSDKLRYRRLLDKLDDVRRIYDRYIGPECMLERNRFMVNNSSLLFACYFGGGGGTKATIDYAKKQGLEIVLL